MKTKNLISACLAVLVMALLPWAAWASAEDETAVAILAYDPGEGQWDGPGPQEFAVGSFAPVAAEEPTLLGMVFIGWNSRADGGGESYRHDTPKDRVPMLEDVTLYAQYGQAVCVLTYDPNGGEWTDGPKPQEYTYGTVAQITQAEPVMNDALFIGWNTRPDGAGDSYFYGGEFGTIPMTESRTLYAQYAPFHRYTLTIEYLFRDGVRAAPPSVITHNGQGQYFVSAPAIEGARLENPAEENLSGELRRENQLRRVYYIKERPGGQAGGGHRPSGGGAAGSGGSGGNSGGGDAFETIPDEKVPLDPWEDAGDILIRDERVPLGSLPQTGGKGRPYLLPAGLGALALALKTGRYGGKRKREGGS